jgi:hypothetical protein
MTPEEREIEKLNKGRLIRIAAEALMPYLRKKKDACEARIIWAHRETKPHELPQAAAELSVLQDLIDELTKNEKQTARLEGEHYERNPPE